MSGAKKGRGKGKRAAAARPVTVLIAAMGGEGGGVLCNWIVSAAGSTGLPVQATSIPGLAQRTGATTYYIEIHPVPRDRLGGRAPLMALYPGVGDVDVMVASELVEAARALQNGFVSPDRTTLIAADHRVYAIAEKTAMGDGRVEADRIKVAAGELAKRAILADFAGAARAHGGVLNAVLLGAIAGSGALPVPSEALADAIRTEGKAVEANLAGFEAGLAILRGTDRGARAEPATAADETAGVAREAFLIEQRNFPDAARELVALGARRVLDFQDQDYETLYLERLERVAAVDTAGDGRLTAEAARQLAVRMTYQDVIRVAQLKTGAERAARVRAEVGARAGEPVVVTEFLEPGLEEACALLPGFVAWPILRWAERRGWTEKLRISLGVRTTGLIGFFSLWLIARMRPWRRIGHRFGDEQTAIDRWLDAVCAAAGRDPDLALEIVACAALFKGYGETHRRGGGNYRRIEEAVIGPALTGAIPVSRAAAAVRAARSAALAGPGGDALAAALAATAGGSDGSAIASVERSDARAAVDAAGSGTTAGAAESKMPATAKGSDAPAVDAGSAGSGGPAAATAVGPTTTVAGGDTAGSRGPAAAAADGPGATAGADGKKTSTATAASAAE